MLDFLRGDADVLVCTTIVESGLDIPSANTLIVERADELGLAQLYQIRGRVGRSRERAYAYLLYPSAAALSEEAGAAARHAVRLHRARLRLQDRDARPRDPRRRQPARRRAVRPRRRGRLRALRRRCSTRPCGCSPATPPTRRAEPVRMDLPVDAYVPGDYVPYEAAKIEIHRRVAGAREVAQLIMLREELEDRFGPIPTPLENLIRLQDARIKLGRAGARSVGFTGGRHVGHADRARLDGARRRCASACRRPSTNRAARPCACGCRTSPPSASAPSSRLRRRFSRSPPNLEDRTLRYAAEFRSLPFAAALAR